VTAQVMADEMRDLKLDVYEHPEVAVGYGQRLIPPLVLFSGGVERGRAVGALPTPCLEAEAEKLWRRHTASAIARDG
jgi:hypothetical protein